MALSAATVWEVRSTATASNANGGGFVTGASGTDYSQQNAAQWNLTGCTSAGADAIILHADAAATMVGNIANVVSGTNATAGRYEIISVVAGVSITVDRNWGTGAVANGVVNIGGALSEVTDAILETSVAGNKWYVKNATYTIGAAISLTAAGSSLKDIEMIGYATTRDDSPLLTTRPTFDYGANTITFGAFWKVRGVIFTGTSAGAVTSGADNNFEDCKFSNTSGTAGRTAFTSGSRTLAYRCEFTSTAGHAAVGNAGTFIGCYFHDSVDGLRGTSAANGVKCVNCIFDTNTTNGFLATAACTDFQLFQNCTFYGAETPAGTGINLAAGNTNVNVINCIVYGFTTGITHGTAAQTSCFDNSNMFFNNTTNATNWTVQDAVTGTNPSFTNATTGNFAVGNSTAKSGGEPGTYPGGLSVSYPAIGAVSPNGAASGQDYVPDLEI